MEKFVNHGIMQIEHKVLMSVRYEILAFTFLARKIKIPNQNECKIKASRSVGRILGPDRISVCVRFRRRLLS